MLFDGVRLPWLLFVFDKVCCLRAGFGAASPMAKLPLVQWNK